MPGLGTLPFMSNAPDPEPLGVHAAGRFDRLENEMRAGFTEMCESLDQIIAGQQHIIDLLNRLIHRRGTP